jgi:glycosyltransferase involved in cell wall biosynthesis
MSRRSSINILELRSIRGSGGGPEKTILHGAALAERARFNISVCYVRDARDREFTLDARARHLNVDYVEVLEQHSFDPGVIRQLTALVRSKQIDIIHAHDYKTDLAAYWVARRTGIIPLATAHGWTGQSRRERLLYYPADRFILRHYPRVIAVSSEIRQRLIDSGASPDRVSVILNGIDPSSHRRLPDRRGTVRASLGFAPTDYVIGAVGRVERQKRFDQLIEAVAPLMAGRANIHLVIVGNGSLLDAARTAAAERNVSDRCHFLGHRTDVADLHHAFDLFVQSSEYEGTPNAILEAMAMETPVVATRAGGTEELFDDGVHGILVPVRNPLALREAILKAIEDPVSASARARAARDRIETELSFVTRTRRLERVYEELVHA